MKNKKMIFGIVIFSFVIEGICSIQNASAVEVEMRPLSYVYIPTKHLEPEDWIWIDIDSNGIINVYIMNDEQLDDLIDSGGLVWNYYKRWRDITQIHESYTITTEDGYFYLVLYNKDILYGRIVNVDISHHWASSVYKPDPTLGIIVTIIGCLTAVIVMITIILLIRRHKRKTLKEVITIQEETPKVIYCRECGAEILDLTKNYCSECGSKIK